MNEKTIAKIKNNPFYKPSGAQQAEIAKTERKPMVEFGTIDKHDNDFDRHPTSPVVRQRINKNTTKKA